MYALCFRIIAMKIHVAYQCNDIDSMCICSNKLKIMWNFQNWHPSLARWMYILDCCLHAIPCHSSGQRKMRGKISAEKKISWNFRRVGNKYTITMEKKYFRKVSVLLIKTSNRSNYTHWRWCSKAENKTMDAINKKTISHIFSLSMSLEFFFS